MDRISLDTLKVKPSTINLGINTIVAWEEVEIYTTGRPKTPDENKRDIVLGVKVILANGVGLLIIDDRKDTNFQKAVDMARRNGIGFLGTSKWWESYRKI